MISLIEISVMSMPLSLSAVRAPFQSPVSVSCSQIEAGGFAFSSERAPGIAKASAAAPARSLRTMVVPLASMILYRLYIEPDSLRRRRYFASSASFRIALKCATPMVCAEAPTEPAAGFELIQRKS